MKSKWKKSETRTLNKKGSAYGKNVDLQNRLCEFESHHFLNNDI